MSRHPSWPVCVGTYMYAWVCICACMYLSMYYKTLVTHEPLQIHYRLHSFIIILLYFVHHEYDNHNPPADTAMPTAQLKSSCCAKSLPLGFRMLRRDNLVQQWKQDSLPATCLSEEYLLSSTPPLSSLPTLSATPHHSTPAPFLHLPISTPATPILSPSHPSLTYPIPLLPSHPYPIPLAPPYIFHLPTQPHSTLPTSF